MDACALDEPGNPASSHQIGRRARRALEHAREEIGQLLGSEMAGMAADRVVFASGGTEANNLALIGLAVQSAGGWAAASDWPRQRPQAIVAAIEHPSVLGAADFLGQLGWQVDRLPADRNGVAHVERIESLFTDRARVVALMLGNNETGVLQPVAELAEICRRGGVACHCDAVQVAGKLPIEFRKLGVSTLSVAAHKFHGPRGIGALLVRHGVELAPMLFGGFQQAGLRPGTEPVALAAGMLAALQAWRDDAGRAARLAELRDSFERELRAGWPELVVNGAAAPRLPHTSNAAFVGLDRQALFMALDQAGIACSTGSACASGSNQPSSVLTAMGCEEAVLRSSLRFSFGAMNRPADASQAAARILKVANDLRRRRPG
jgi:cysteine desulfurase